MKQDKILTQFSVAYRNENNIAELIMPVVRVKERSGKFAKYDKSNLRVDDNIERAPGTQARSFDYGVSQGSYTCTEKALEKIVPDEMILNSDDPYDPKRDATIFAVDRIDGYREVALATAMADTSIITQNVTLSGTDQWSDTASSDPIDDIMTGYSTIQAATGKTPNVAVMGFDVWQELRAHPDVVDRIKYVGITSDQAIMKALADMIGVKEVLVGTAIQNTANEGQAESLSSVWGKHFWLLHRAERPSLMAPTFGYTMKDVDRVVDTRRDEARMGEVVRVRDSFDQVVVDASLAYLIKDCVA